MILTNDGELANRLAHPRYGVEKTYRALVAGRPDQGLLAKLTEGIWLSDGKVRAKRARFAGSQGEATTIELVLAEGKKREIRRMLAKLGHKVMNLTRIAIGPVSLKGLSLGEHRHLSRTEVDLLRKVAAGEAVSPSRFSDPAGGGARLPTRFQGRSSARPEPARRERRPPRGRIQDEEKHSLPERERRANRPGGPSTPSRPSVGPRPGVGARKASDSHPSAGDTTSSSPSSHASIPPRSRERRPAARRESQVGAPPIRRIIGLDPKLAERSGLSLAGRAARKRPGLKRRPPRAAAGLKRVKREGGDER
jgi:23S rRNA pseudouridine2605 synthase